MINCEHNSDEIKAVKMYFGLIQKHKDKTDLEIERHRDRDIDRDRERDKTY